MCITDPPSCYLQILLIYIIPFDSYGNIFAHWAKECEALLKGKHDPVFSLQKRKLEDDTEVSYQAGNLHYRTLKCMTLS